MHAVLVGYQIPCFQTIHQSRLFHYYYYTQAYRELILVYLLENHQAMLFVFYRYSFRFYHL